MKKSLKKDIEQILLEDAVRQPVESGKRKKDEQAVSVVPADDNKLAPFVSLTLKPLIDSAHKQVVVVCFGTTSISGDALGPMVGTMLKDKYRLPTFVYGTEQLNVNGKNMSEWMAFIKEVHSDAVFVAVDASLGSSDKVGQILVREDGVCPAAIKGKRTRFGDIGILAVVAENKGDALMQLMSVSPVDVEKMAVKIAAMIDMSCGRKIA